ncbi:hypothetical protein SAMN04490243_2494 [Robiginitalea myxolifaciens]|uniref:Haem-binding uptake, Tiki superfamily, ChaN n=1 Tax=Robiginitalea myxolifaciens TaxID=400055 RepID=A0A1I6HAZ1_9FLAO|nr:DUF5694 domain-containing protein [Robiginitalea myxolifaciens]SFR51578.1 hypothetical protein SAMN04490243_2494 [Robiginitalea myxolifaciens]
MRTAIPAALTLFLILFLSACKDQKETTQAAEPVNTVLDTLKGPSDFYPSERTKVLVVGTFHFEYPGLDAHKTSDDDKIDVLEEPKRSELEELIAHIAKFKPNKIAIEARPSWNTMGKFEAYKNGEHADKRDERYTLGMRMARDMNLDTIYSLDAQALINELFVRDSNLVKSLTGKIDWEAPDPYWELSKKWLDYDDKIIPKMNLLDYFKVMNSRENHLANYGLYLTGSMGKAEGQSADHLSMWWYNRNLRIFSKIVAMTEGPEDRILVIFGNGHAAVLRQFFEASPQYEFVEFDSL